MPSAKLAFCLALCSSLIFVAAGPSRVAEGDVGRAKMVFAPPRLSAQPLEFPDDPPAPLSVLTQRVVEPARAASRGPFVSVQVNVDVNGDNIIGDAANEPTIAIDPTNPDRIVIAWRQFDTIASNFREAGVAYSHDRGQTWTATTLDPGQFRSDPVLGADPNGDFYFSSLSSAYSAEVFKSIDGGVTWSPPVNAFGGDKQWMAVDRTAGIGRGNVYQIWNVQFSCCPPNDFTRSTNGGASFESPIALPNPRMKWGTMDVDPDGELYLAGATLDQSSHVVGKSTDAQDPSVTPTFDFVNLVYLGGVTSGWGGPNPGGLAGQVWIATDHSGGPTRGNVYILGSVDPPGADPLDVMFIRSTDGGATWTAPVRVNDDPIGNEAWQWFGTMSVAPSGRIDVVWNDTRNTGATNLSELFYTFSLDAGVTWSANIPVSPVFDSWVGWPNQNKIGDYYHMISDDSGASLAYSATFNDEQDVYFLRISQDCNLSGTPDVCDIDCNALPSCGPPCGFSEDCNSNNVPDECEPDEDCQPNGTQDICDIADGTSDDCNGNQVPDECEPDEDCQPNGIQDICDIADGTSDDCNENQVPDECDIDSGTSPDDNGDGVPDECQGACCVCGECVDTTYPDCAAQGGDFVGLGVLCAAVTCPVLGNDDCLNKEFLLSVPYQSVAFDNHCATNDGPALVACDNGTQPFGADIWYNYLPPCTGDMTVSLCDNTYYDAILAIYGGNPACECPIDDSSQLACSDDSCGVGGGPPTITIPVQEGACYTIRVAGWDGSTGAGQMDVSVVCEGCWTSSSAQPEMILNNQEQLVVSTKNRFLSFSAGDPGQLQMIRVKFISLPAPFDQFNGRSMWVGEPFDVSEIAGSTDATPPTFKAAKLMCEADAHSTDWSTLGTIHVYSAFIVPNGQYEIRLLDVSCTPAQIEDDAVSPPLFLDTSAFGDVCARLPLNNNGQWGPPDGVAGITSDVLAVLNKSLNKPGLIKARADLGAAIGNPEPDLTIDITRDVIYALEGFLRRPYPFAPPPWPCP